MSPWKLILCMCISHASLWGLVQAGSGNSTAVSEMIIYLSAIVSG